ncbi:MAG: AraC family transcriptional regulator ligand-binding domain-containing protein [Porticoccaceae bacterium]
MAEQRSWLECDTRFIPAHYQPVTLIDLALARGVNEHRLLQGSGLFYDDILRGDKLISAQQFICLIDNARQQMQADDTSFLIGHQWLPGHYGAASHALRHAGNLLEALERLVRLQPLLSPLMTPRLRLDEHHAWLCWDDSFGASPQSVFLIEASMTAVSSLSQWLSGQKLPWSFYLSHAQPRYIEQYWVHLGERLRFGCPRNQMYLPREYLLKPWIDASATAGRVAEQEGLDMMAALPAPASVLDDLHDYLVAQIRTPLRLEQIADAFAMSPATLKRKLKKHGSHFQEQLDRARAAVAMELYLSRGYSSEDVAEYLNFSDRANFRRALRRWTGFLPSELSTWLG